MMIPLGQCERCEEPAITVNEDNNALCEDCIFEETCEAMFADPFDEGES